MESFGSLEQKKYWEGWRLAAATAEAVRAGCHLNSHPLPSEPVTAVSTGAVSASAPFCKSTC